MTTRLELRYVAIALATALFGCGAADDAGDTKSWLEIDPLGELPAKLSAVGIYRGAAVDLPLAPALAYEPSYPLWSDGGQKYRSLVLPQGSNIDTRDPDNYVFPIGTLLFKTFAFRTPASPSRSVPVETRVLRLKGDGWELGAYGWNDAGTDADLLALKRSEIREVLNEDDEILEHAIPSRLECRQCHESATSEVLGVNELQLAGTASLGALTPRLAPAPATPPRALPEHGALTTAVLGYFVGNCVHCHNGSNGAASSFDLRPEAALANVVEQPTASSATADGIRVAPGEPEESVLYLGVRGGDELEIKAMPPLGVAERDASAVKLLGDWIRALGDDEDP